MHFLTQENKDLSGPLAKDLEKQRDLEEKLKTYTMDKMALKSLRARCKQLEERTGEARSECKTARICA